MKVLIVNQHVQDTIGGSEIQCDIISRYLSKNGHNIIYLAMSAKSTYYNYSYKVYPISKLSIKEIYKILRDTKPDIIYWRFNKKYLLPFVIIAKILNIKIVFALSHINDIKKWVVRPINKKNKNILLNFFRKIRMYIFSIRGRINFLALRFVDGIITQNKVDLNLIPNYIPESIFIRNSIEKKSTNQSFRWKKPFILWVANVKKAKNPELFIKLASKFYEMNFDIDFIMVGKIQDKNYEYIKDEERLPKNLYYLGSKSPTEVNNIISKSLFLVHTCDPEGFPNIFIQTWLQEKPVVSLYYDPDDIIKNNNLGFFSGNMDQLINDVKYLINNEKERQELGINARRFAEEEFKPDNNIAKLEAFLSKIIYDKSDKW